MENRMKRYIITVATELDGHAGSEAYFVETKNEFPKKEMLNILFKNAKIDNEFVINHEKENNIYGTTYGFEFAMKWREIEDYKTNKIYYLSSRTG